MMDYFEVITNAVTGEQTIRPYTEAEILALRPKVPDFQRAFDEHVEAVARARGYNSAASLAGYTTSAVNEWSDEAMNFVAWRDQFWQAAFTLMQAVLAGERSAPETVEAALEELPQQPWAI